MRVVSSSVGTIRVSPSVQSTNMGLSKKHTVLLGYNITIAVCVGHTHWFPLASGPVSVALMDPLMMNYVEKYSFMANLHGFVSI